MKLARTNALIPMSTSADTDTFGKEGYPVDANSDGTVDLCADATGNPPFGVIVLGAEHPGKATIAVAADAQPPRHRSPALEQTSQQ